MSFQCSGWVGLGSLHPLGLDCVIEHDSPMGFADERDEVAI